MNDKTKLEKILTHYCYLLHWMEKNAFDLDISPEQYCQLNDWHGELDEYCEDNDIILG